MSYKYRNDETPDHVDSSQSNADYPHLGIESDSTKKAPVDTVRLKSDIHKDKQAEYDLSNTVGETTTSSGSKKQLNDYFKNITPDMTSTMDRASDALHDRANARKDTLDMARKGKIPAK